MPSTNTRETKRYNIACKDTFEPYQLNVLDIFQARFVFEVVYFFDEKLDGELLKDKLRLLLKGYPYLAGRYVKGQGESLTVVPCEEGVKFVVCLSDCAYPHPSHQKHCKESLDGLLEKINPLAPHKSSLFTVKLTHFTDTGSALGVSISHGLADAYGLFRIVNDWANMDLTQAPKAATTGFFQKPDPIKGMTIQASDREKAAELYKTGSMHGYRRLGWVDFVAFMFKFFTRKSRIEARVCRLSAAELSNMKQSMRGAIGQDHITQNDALSAHLWHVIHALEKNCAKYWRKESSSRRLLMIGGIRGNIVKSINSDYLGNAVNPLLISADKNELSMDDTSPLALKIRASANAFTEHKLEEQMLWLKKALQEKQMVRIFSGNDPYRNDLFISSFVRCPVYSACFSGIRPRWVTPPMMPAPWVIQVMPAPDGGMDVHFYLYKEVAKLLDSDFFQALLHRYQH